ncbi:hypothetical protein C8R43DRAFT_1031206 [Mycena crocata]|nr:hypothetical protein C8R43DRAFT_1031206 [Mycena crocata]
MPVLTRRAYKSIARWLPNEIISETIQHLTLYPDLLALCLTSRLFNGLATPVLYRNINLSTPAAINACFTTLKCHSQSRSHCVRQLTISHSEDGEFDDNLELSPHLIAEMVPIFQDLRCLQHLELFVHSPIAPLLRNAHFPELLCFKTGVDPLFSTALCPFINRHPTLTSLELFRSSACLPNIGSPVPQLGTLSCPNLTLFNGPGCHAAGLVVANQSLTTLTVVWHSDDPSVAPALAALAAAVPKDSPIGFNAFCGRDVSQSDVLQAVVEGLPHIAVLYLMGTSPGQRISPATVCDFGQIFKAFPALYVLKLGDLGGPTVYEESLEEDRRIVKSWGKACRSLWSISLHGHEWSRAATGSWVIITSE